MQSVVKNDYVSEARSRIAMLLTECNIAFQDEIDTIIAVLNHVNDKDERIKLEEYTDILNNFFLKNQQTITLLFKK